MRKDKESNSLVEVFLHSDNAIITWGKGSGRVSYALSKPLALALMRYSDDNSAETLSMWISSQINVDMDGASEVALELLANGFSCNHDFSIAEKSWDVLGWSAAKTIFCSSFDSRWVHDYRGNPKVMVKRADYTNAALDSTPMKIENTWEKYTGHVLSLPQPLDATALALPAIRQRRTIRNFTGSNVSLDQIATICRWTFGRQHLDNTRFVAHTYLNNNPITCFVLIDRRRIKLPSLPEEYTGNILIGIYNPENHALKLIPSTSSVEKWSGLLWKQRYANGAAFSMIFVSNLNVYMDKYPISRSYNWVWQDAGTFMQTAIFVGSGLGLSAFQTPAIDDEFVVELLNLDPTIHSPSYFVTFGER